MFLTRQPNPLLFPLLSFASFPLSDFTLAYLSFSFIPPPLVASPPPAPRSSPHICNSVAVAGFCWFTAPLTDNSPVLTGWSYYPLYEKSMLRALYEILVPVDKMMELVSAVIPQPYNGISWEIHNAMDY